MTGYILMVSSHRFLGGIAFQMNDFVFPINFLKVQEAKNSRGGGLREGLGVDVIIKMKLKSVFSGGYFGAWAVS